MDNFCRQLLYFLIHSIHFFTVFSMESQMMQRSCLPPARFLPAVGFPLIYQSYGDKVMVILYDLVLMSRYSIGLFQLGIKAEQGQQSVIELFCASEIFHCNVNVVNARLQKLLPPHQEDKADKGDACANSQVPVADCWDRVLVGEIEYYDPQEAEDQKYAEERYKPQG